MGDDSIEALCHQCGKTFSTFLHRMQEQNSRVVCPDCLANGDCAPPKAVSGAVSQPAKPVSKPN